jgi:hypothetical protein
MERKTKERRTQLQGKRSQKVEKRKEEKMEKATKTKQPKATQGKKPAEDKFLSARDLAQMAEVTPAILRRTLRKNFSGKIPRDNKDGRQYQIKATDPLVKEIIAKAKANKNGNKVTTAPANKDKGEGEKPSPESSQPKPRLKTLPEIQASQKNKGLIIK